MTAAKKSQTGALAPPSEMTPSQEEAFQALLPFCTGQGTGPRSRVLSGYAGTGKTWLAVHLIRAAGHAGLRVAVCAPTHKAVAVINNKLTEAGGAKIRTATLHALLGLKLQENHDGTVQIGLDRHPNTSYLENHDMIFIDESSMVGPELLAYIHRFTKTSEARILYIGDPGQLLPVTAKGVDRDTPPLQLTDDPEALARPPVFDLVPTRHHLTDIVRQKATGKPHPIVQFAQEIRRYIEGEAQAVFDPETIRIFLENNGTELGAVRLADADNMAAGVVKLRARRPDKDIRAIAWRNQTVDTCNRLIHNEMASVYGAVYQPGQPVPPFWLGETLVAREALYAFPLPTHIHEEGAKTWEKALAPQNKNRSHVGNLADLIPNNTEMVVRDCAPLLHPYLNIMSWFITADLADGDPIQFFVANDPREHQQLARKTWDSYRQGGRKTAEGFRRAWAVTRACAPVTHAYAMTAHKAQGSTFHYALIDLTDLYGMVRVSGRDEYHRALYVAVTRAAERVWLCT